MSLAAPTVTTLAYAPVNRRSCLIWAGALALSGCATQAPPGPQTDQHWSGRLSLRIDEQPIRQYHAQFELSGSPTQGQLVLLTPLGQTLAQADWGPESAQLTHQGDTRFFKDLNDLTLTLTGADLPIAALFSWLKGVDTPANGWLADLTQLNKGRLEARRQHPEPTALLRLIID